MFETYSIFETSSGILGEIPIAFPYWISMPRHSPLLKGMGWDVYSSIWVVGK